MTTDKMREAFESYMRKAHPLITLRPSGNSLMDYSTMDAENHYNTWQAALSNGHVGELADKIIAICQGTDLAVHKVDKCINAAHAALTNKEAK